MGDVYTVEHIIKHRGKADSVFEFLVKWQGYDASHNSWEPQDNILDLALLARSAEREGDRVSVDDRCRRRAPCQ